MLYPDIDPVLLALGPLKIRWYGLMYLVGFAAAWLLARYRAARPGSGWRAQEADDLIFYCALGAVLGGRIGYILFYGYQDWLDDPLRLVRVWEGGMSFHGGFLGVIAAIALFVRRTGKSFFGVADYLAPLTPLGLFAGRIGNFINGELWGGPASVPWAMQVQCAEFAHLCYDKLQLPLGTGLSPPLHPSQLYQALGEGLLLFIILWLYSQRPRPTMSVSAVFLLGYGLFRFLVEFVRMPDAHLGYLAFGWLTMGQLLSLPMILGGLGLLIWAYRRPRPEAAG